MQIRSYQHDDFESVWNLHVLVLQHAGVYRGSGPWDDDLYHIEEKYIQDSGVFLVGILNDELIAMGALRRTDEERAEIKRMRVHPDFQGRGFGKMMLQELEKHAMVLEYKILHLDTSTVQLVAQHLYRKHGFQETGESIVRQGFTDLFFEKHL